MPNHIEYLEIAFKVSKIIPKSIIDFKVSKPLQSSTNEFELLQGQQIITLNHPHISSRKEFQPLETTFKVCNWISTLHN